MNRAKTLRIGASPIGSRASCSIALLAMFALAACSADALDQTPGVVLENDASTADIDGSAPANELDGGADNASDAALDANAKKPLPALTWTTEGPRGGDAVVLSHVSYDYAPTVMHDGVYRMWWCGGIAGDHILYAEATALNGPWHGHASTKAYDDVFQPTGDATGFDGEQTCDPSIVRTDGVYYMYYGGLAKRGAPLRTTQIGVARSDDGYSWTRLNGGAPILTTVRDYKTVKNGYGAGQPSAIFKDGKFWLLYTDTTGLGGNQGNGAGQYVLRSADPTFQTGVEELTATGFLPRTAANHTGYSLLEAFSVDWQYADSIDAFVVASHPSSGLTKVTLFDGTTLKELPGSAIQAAGHWRDGPGIVSRPDKHALPGPNGSCNTIPFDFMTGMSTAADFKGPTNTWDLTHSGLDLVVNRACADVPLPRVYEGTRVAAPGRPLAVIADGTRVQFKLAPPASRLARSEYAVPVAVYDAIPYGASISTGNEVLGAPGRPAAFHLDGKHLWPTSCLEIVTDNQSAITTTTVAAWDAIPRASTLRCLK